MPLNVNQNVFIVSVLDLKDIADKTVSTKGICEIFNSLLILFGSWLSKLSSEVVHNRWVCSSSLLFDRWDRKRVRNDFDQTTVWASCNNLVWLEPKWQFGCPEYLVTLTNELHGKGLLPQVIVCFDDHSKKLPSFKIWEWRIFLESNLLLLWCFQENLIVITIVKKVNFSTLSIYRLANLWVRFDKFWILL